MVNNIMLKLDMINKKLQERTKILSLDENELYRMVPSLNDDKNTKTISKKSGLIPKQKTSQTSVNIQEVSEDSLDEDSILEIYENDQSISGADFSETTMFENASVLPPKLMNSTLNYEQLKEIIRRKSKQKLIQKLSSKRLKTGNKIANQDENENKNNSVKNPINPSSKVLIPYSSNSKSLHVVKEENQIENNIKSDNKEHDECKDLSDYNDNTLIEYESLANLNDCLEQYCKTEPSILKENNTNSNVDYSTNMTTQNTPIKTSAVNYTSQKTEEKKDKCLIF